MSAVHAQTPTGGEGSLTQTRQSKQAQGAGRVLQGAGFTPTQSMILHMQRTAGNAAVNALLGQYRSGGIAQLLSIQRAVTSIQGRTQAIAGNLTAPPHTEPAPSHAEEAATEPAVIQRKLAFDKHRFDSLVSTKAKFDSSTFVQIKNEYSKYLKMNKPLDEVLAMKRMRTLIEAWLAKNGSSKKANDLIKQKVLQDLGAAITAELPQAKTKAHKWHLTTKIGLPAAYLDTWNAADVDLLGQASQAFSNGQTAVADKHLTTLRASVAGVVDLLRSALVAHHLGAVDPEMAKVLGNPDYRVGKEDSLRATAHMGDRASDRATKADPGELSFFGDVYKSLPKAALERQDKAKDNKVNGLDTGEATAILGYTTPLFGEVNNPLRKDMGTKRFDANKQAVTKATISGLNKLKPLVARVYRHTGIFPGYKELNQVGATVSDMGFMSSTKSQFMAGAGGKEHLVLEIVESKTGRDVSEASTFAHEQEVLFKPGTRFQITKRFDLNQQNSVWNPNLDDEAKKYLASDSKKTELLIILFKKEI
jgi:hypothetical protein